MKIEYDSVKEQLDLTKNEISHARFVDLGWHTASVYKDERTGYGEARYVATAELASRLYVSCFTPRGDVFSVISLRKANKREGSIYYGS